MAPPLDVAPPRVLGGEGSRYFMNEKEVTGDQYVAGFKKGGAVQKSKQQAGEKLNLKNCKVSTASRNKSNSNW
jgi:hypothetical protein